MTELEWLKQESGLTDDELKAMEAVAGHTKFVGMLQKMIGTNEASMKAKTDAEQARIDLENRYQNEFIPEMRKVTTDALAAKGEAARLAAQLQQAREYGIVPDAPVQQQQSAQAQGTQQEVRAPGSPDPQEQFRQWSQAQSRAIITLNDLSAEHFKLFKEPLSNSQELVDEVQRQHTLGHRDFTLQKAWESKFNVPTKRAEIQAAEQQKFVDEKVQAALKEDRQKRGANPGLVSGQPSRFATYKPSEANSGSEPWKVPAGMKKAANQPWREKAIQKVAAA
jgi:hypothetical protein